jgi:hypothetical protein
MRGGVMPSRNGPKGDGKAIEMAHRPRRTLFTAALFASLAGAGAAAAAQGDSQSCPVGTAAMDLKPGQFVWAPAAAPAGPVFIVISLPQQRAYVYRNGIEIGIAAVSTGRPGYVTPTGVFRVLEKDAEHYSSLYDNAPMPYMLRLTWGGVALHAGRDPGSPASHGCIRLPYSFARSLFAATPVGSTVVVTNSALAPGLRLAPKLFSAHRDTPGAPGDFWAPDRAPDGPISIVVSGADARLSVIRAGIEIGRAAISISGEEPLHTHALLLMANGDPSRAAGQPAASGRWMPVDLPGDAALPPERRRAQDVDRIRLPRAFADALAGILQPGTTMLISDAPLAVAVPVLETGRTVEK